MSSPDGWLIVHNATCLDWPAAETPQLAAAGPLVAVLLAVTQLSRPPSMWPAVLFAMFTVGVGVAAHGTSSPVPCNPDAVVSGCTLYAAWVWSAVAMLGLQVLEPFRAASDLTRAVLVEVAVAHAVLGVALWPPAMAGAYGAAATPSRVAALEMGPVEIFSGDYGDDNDGWGRAATLALRSTAIVLSAQLAAERRPARAWPWVLAGGVAIACATAIVAATDNACPGHALAGNHTCAPSHVVPYCDEGALHTDCTFSLAPLVAMAGTAVTVSLNYQVRGWLRRRPRAVQWVAVLVAVLLGIFACHVAFVLPFRVDAERTGLAGVPDRRDAHIAVCSVWQSHAAHLYAAAAVLLGIGPALALLMPEAPHAVALRSTVIGHGAGPATWQAPVVFGGRGEHDGGKALGP